MQNLKKRSLADVSRQDILDLCERYKDNKPRLRQLLVALFAKRENIHLFGWFVNQAYVRLETPNFHKEIYSLVSDKSIPYIGIGAPRGHAKSTTVDFTYPLWSACYRQHHFAIIISDTYTQSVEFVNALKDQFENNLLVRWLYGDLMSDTWRDGEFVLSTGIKFLAMGAGMKIRGLRFREYRPDLLIVDDLENDEQVNSAEQRKKLKNWFIKAALPALSKDGRCIVIGTILHHDSLLSNILNRKEMFASWTTRLYTAMWTDENGREHALWPEHMDLDYLTAIRDDPKHPKYIGSIAFAQEYQQKPFDEEDAIIQPSWIQWADKAPDELHTVASVLAIDPAASEKQTADPTAKLVVKLGLDGNVYVCAISNKKQSPTKSAKETHDMYIVFEPNAVAIEEGILNLVFKDLLAGLPVIGVKPDKDKVRRLLAVARFFEAGRVYIVKGIKNAQALYDQLIEFPSGSHDDMVDALVYAIRLLLVDGMVSDDDIEVAGNYPTGDDDDGEDDDDDDESDNDW